MRPSWRADLIALLAGTAAGAFVLGGGGRAAMALLRLATGGASGFTWGGTLDVLIVGTGYGLLGGLVLALLRRFPPVSLGGRGAAVGVVLLALAWATSPVGRATARSAPVSVPAVLAVSAVVFVLYGLAAEALRRRWSRRGAA